MKRTIVVAPVSTMMLTAFVQPASGVEDPEIPLDPQRVVDIEWFLATDQLKEVELMDATDEEYAAASARLRFTEVQDGLEDRLVGFLDSEAYAGHWIGFDGKTYLAYVGSRPEVTELPSADVLDYVLVEREVPLTDRLSEAGLADMRYDVVTDQLRPRPVATEEFSNVTDAHNRLNRLPGIEMSVNCITPGSGPTNTGQLGYFVTWYNGGVRSYGWLTVAHLIEEEVDSNGDGLELKCHLKSTLSDGTEKWTNGGGNKMDVFHDDSGAHSWLGRVYRGLYNDVNNSHDAMVITMPKLDAQKERIHLDGGTADNSRTPPSDWTQHGVPLRDVHAGTLSFQQTLCMIPKSMNDVKCGWYEGNTGGSRYEISFSGSPFPAQGDSGGPVFTADSAASGGPRAVGLFGGKEINNPFDTDYFFYRVHDQLTKLGSEYSAFTGTLEVCSRSADGSWDYNCDPANS